MLCGKISLYRGHPGICKDKADQKQSEMGTGPVSQIGIESSLSFHIKKLRIGEKSDHARVNFKRNSQSKWAQRWQKSYI